MNRRQLLKALGLTGTGLALGARPSLALGQDDGGPIRRLIILSNGHGNVHSGFRIPFAGRPDTDTWTAPLAELGPDDWSEILAPLQRHASRLNVLDGLSLATPELDLPGYRHEKGWIHAWTGNNAMLTGSNLFATSPSLDQIVAREIARIDRLPSVELSIEYGRPVTHAGRAQPIPLEESPSAAFARLFGGDTGPVPGAGPSVLDFARSEYEALMPRLGSADRTRLEQHRDLVRDLEGRLAGLASMECAQSEGLDGLGADGYDAHFDSYVELITAAFACDATRVATVSLGDLPQSALPIQPESGNVHDSWAHELYGRDEARIGMTAYMAVHAEQLARLLDRLESIDDPQGGSLLDHTLIAWGSEMADGWHGYERYCVVLAGGSWALEGGRYHHTPYETGPIEVVTYDGVKQGGIPHQHLLVSLAQAMGLQTDHIGLREVMNRQGDLVDLTGPLGGL